jgi:hypothetical protein
MPDVFDDSEQNCVQNFDWGVLCGIKTYTIQRSAVSAQRIFIQTTVMLTLHRQKPTVNVVSVFNCPLD